MQTFLVLDDQESYRMMATVLLKDLGEVIEVATVPEALAALRKNKITGVLADWNLHPDGRREGPYSEPVVREALGQDIPVMIISGTDDTTGRLAGLQKEFQGKPLRLASKEDSFAESLTGWPSERR